MQFRTISLAISILALAQSTYWIWEGLPRTSSSVCWLPKYPPSNYPRLGTYQQAKEMTVRQADFSSIFYSFFGIACLGPDQERHITGGLWRSWRSGAVTGKGQGVRDCGIRALWWEMGSVSGLTLYGYVGRRLLERQLGKAKLGKCL